MAGRIRDADVVLVRERARIDEVIGERLQLRPAGGGRLKGLCPFHDEKSPSFNVNPSLGFYHCLAGETRVLTWEGTRSIRDLAGGTHRVLGRTGDWVDAPFRSYGHQELLAITVTRNGQSQGPAGHRRPPLVHPHRPAADPAARGPHDAAQAGRPARPPLPGDAGPPDHPVRLRHRPRHHVRRRHARRERRPRPPLRREGRPAAEVVPAEQDPRGRRQPLGPRPPGLLQGPPAARPSRRPTSTAGSPATSPPTGTSRRTAPSA